MYKGGVGFEESHKKFAADDDVICVSVAFGVWDT